MSLSILMQFKKEGEGVKEYECKSCGYVFALDRWICSRCGAGIGFVVVYK
jgi:uncharacterized OB-fold protein